MLFRWLKRRRRKKILARPFPPEWERYLREHVPFHGLLGADERRRLEGIVQVLVEEKNWEGCGGLELSEEMTVNISSQAALLILNLRHDYFRSVKSILVYPSTFILPKRPSSGGMVVEQGQPVLGLAHHRGPVVLSWDDARHGAYNPSDGRNVVLHEFAHKLDLLDDYADGTPPLRDQEQYDAWVRIMTKEFERLQDRTRKGQSTVLDKYGAEEPVEFFAVATECFFEKPDKLERRRPELYRLLSEYYRQDPARWA